MATVDVFAEYLEHHPLPHGYSDRIRTISELARFILNAENYDGGFIWWRHYAAICPEFDDVRWKQALRIIRSWDDTKALVDTGDTPMSVFHRTTEMMHKMLVDQSK